MPLPEDGLFASHTLSVLWASIASLSGQLLKWKSVKRSLVLWMNFTGSGKEYLAQLWCNKIEAGLE